MRVSYSFSFRGCIAKQVDRKEQFPSHQYRSPSMNSGGFLVLATLREVSEFVSSLLFCSMSFALTEHKLPLSLTMCWSAGILLDKVAIHRAAIEVVLLKCCRTSIIPQISPTITVNNSNRKIIAIKALKLFSVFAELEDFCLVHVFQQLLRCFTEPCSSSASGSYLEEIVPCTDGTQTSRSTWRL